MMNSSSYLYSDSEDFKNVIVRLGNKNNSITELYVTSRFKNTNNMKFEASISKIVIDRLDSSYINVTKNIFYCDSTSTQLTDSNIDDYHFINFDVS
jgi:hypothetical protein